RRRRRGAPGEDAAGGGGGGGEPADDRQRRRPAAWGGRHRRSSNAVGAPNPDRAPALEIAVGRGRPLPPPAGRTASIITGRLCELRSRRDRRREHVRRGGGACVR